MKTYPIICLTLGIFLFSSCEKVVDIDLNQDETALVVEAQLMADTNDFVVQLSQTSNYFDNEATPTVSDATVMLTNLVTEKAIQLTAVGNGKYVAPGYIAQAGATYNLSVTSNGNNYSGNSYLPTLVPLDSLTYRFEEASVFGEEGYTIFCELEDPKEVRNFYRVIVTLNGELQNKPEDFFLFDDEFTNGNHIRIPLFTKRFKAGDQVTFQLLCMDEVSYKYITAVSQLATGESQSSTAPANPVSNLNGGAFGYFGAFSATSKTLILPE